MPQQVEGGDDGVVYLGKGSFKMKVGANVTPPAGTPPAPKQALQLAPRIKKVTPTTPPPVLNTPAPLVVTPPPA